MGLGLGLGLGLWRLGLGLGLELALLAQGKLGVITTGLGRRSGRGSTTAPPLLLPPRLCPSLVELRLFHLLGLAAPLVHLVRGKGRGRVRVRVRVSVRVRARVWVWVRVSAPLVHQQGVGPPKPQRRRPLQLH